MRSSRAPSGSRCACSRQAVIDRDGLHKCNLRGLREALWACQPADVSLVDGFRLGPTAPPHRAVVDGDMQERRHRCGLDRREGDARPVHAHGRRAVSRVRLCIARRATSLLGTRRSCASAGRARSTAARGVRVRTSPKKSSPRHPSERRGRVVVPPAWLPRARRELLGGRRTSSTSSFAAGGCSSSCEVKSKAGDGFGDPLEMVTPVKVERVRRAADAWLRSHPALARPRCALRRGRRAGGPAGGRAGRVLAHVEPQACGDAGAALRRPRPRPLLVGARPARARADEARPPAPSLPRQVHPAARRGAVPPARAPAWTRARSVRRVRDDARAGARDRARLDRASTSRRSTAC